MATRTISAAGGNFNATSSWVEGIVPVSADDIIATSASGNLTVNAASTVRSIQFDGGGIGDFWSGQLTLSSDFTINGAGAVGTVSLSPSMSMTGSSLFFTSATGIYTTYGMTISTSWRMVGNKTLRDTINWQIPNGVASRFFQGGQHNVGITATWSGATPSINLWFNENQAAFPATFTGVQTNGGSASWFFKPHNGTVNIANGLWSEAMTPWKSSVFFEGGAGTFSIGVMTLYPGGSITYISGGITQSGTTLTSAQGFTQQGVSELNFPPSIPLSYLRVFPGLNFVIEDRTITIQNSYGLINAGAVHISTQGNQSNGRIDTIRWNTGLSASRFDLVSSITPTGFVGGIYTPSVIQSTEFSSGFTYSFGIINSNSPTGRQNIIKSFTASQPASIIIGSTTQSSISYTDLTDINFIGSEDIIAPAGNTFLRTTGITNSIPSGGGAGGSFTFLS